ncbi:NADH-quinone oxidoreductase subunit NuoN [Parapusillimonas granuli]|uniref:NADH-quinone oxidoreductase subunit N n=1 Tax=Parapusillimonas granuli TaxID=380911 RepID=A0A853GAH3_9BURK|nr:NADH-quinone oxidoreductase subunit NuoN [Parapusillimonas granuli]MBB5216717.1 NADH-quinone oxidoreductase subunit N [Parapusillimonas granuli]MEB2400046.1 NADH-quinone oxidoreductase subunit NuoN [Alcaligenaceae bacterium]NYT51776.1 NADH-quinone oxidoreductase subunit NuoN [Parapusillimonas granuli]
MQNPFDFALATPEISLLIMACAILLVDAFNKTESRHTTFTLSIGAMLVLTVISLWQWSAGVRGNSFGGLYVVDDLAHFLKVLSYIAVAATMIYGREYSERRDMVKHGGELYCLALFALLGQMIMISAGSMITVYLGVELMSFALYALVALRRDHIKATEAAMKYFVLGALASGVLLYGMSMIYGATGQLDMRLIAQVIGSGNAERLPLVFGVVFIVSGLAFKLTAAPFHMWTPDVYQGAPTSVTLIVGAAPKFAAFAITLRLLIEGLHGIAIDWQPMLLLMAVLSLAIGNLAAIMQTNFKRMLAYSTISHMGFVFLGLLSGVVEGQAAVAGWAYGSALFYVVIYVLTTLVTFGLILLLSREGFECEEIADLKGLNRRNPVLAGLLLLAMFSLTGIPPMAGFYAKLAVLQALVGAGYVTMAVIAVLFSLIGAFYYLRVVKVAYFDEPEGELVPVNTGVVTNGLMSLNGALILVLGILPGGLMTLCVQVIESSLKF